MVTDEQVRRLMKSLRNGKNLAVSAARAGMERWTLEIGQTAKVAPDF